MGCGRGGCVIWILWKLDFVDLVFGRPGLADLKLLQMPRAAQKVLLGGLLVTMGSLLLRVRGFVSASLLPWPKNRWF